MEKETLQTTHENTPALKPGAQLARIRENKGIAREIVATKLHFREQTLELLEADAYDLLPEPVFIKGYIRAYAKFLGVASEPLIDAFNQVHNVSKPVERTLWQPRKASRSYEKILRSLSVLVTFSVVVVFVSWWYQHNQLVKQVGQKFKSVVLQEQTQPATTKSEMSQVSKLRSLFEPASAADNRADHVAHTQQDLQINHPVPAMPPQEDKLTALPANATEEENTQDASDKISVEAQSG